jgi:uncharacterized protein with PQ loop repeat
MNLRLSGGLNMIELIGWIGGIFLSICTIPQAIKVYKEKTAKGLSWGMIYLWLFGEVLTVAYILHGNISSGVYQIPLLFNYFVNIILVSYLIWAKHHYDETPKNT